MAEQGTKRYTVICDLPGAPPRLLEIELPQGSCLGDATQLLRDTLPATVDWDSLSIGIWGQRSDPGRSLKDGDRIEIYRSLLCDPVEARRERARRLRSAAARRGS